MSLASNSSGASRRMGSCDRDSLALTSRQRDAALAEFGFKCVRQSLDEFGGAGENRCTFDLGVVS
jgi:hypothetical protein